MGTPGSVGMSAERLARIQPAVAKSSPTTASLGRSPSSPGTAWRYSIAHDVLAYLIEALSDRPLGMVDTGYCVREGELDRFAAMYGSLCIEERDTTTTQWYMRAAEGVNQCLARPEDSREAAPHGVSGEAAASSPQQRTMTGSHRCCWATASSRGRASSAARRWS